MIEEEVFPDLKNVPLDGDFTTRKILDKKDFMYEVFPHDKIQEKVDYYITPYNNIIGLNKYMDFGEELNLNMIKEPEKAPE